MAKKKAAAEAAPEVTADANAPAPEVTATPAVEQPAAATPAKVERTKQNGITRPLPESITGRLWGIADEISGELGRAAPRKLVVERFRAELGDRANDATAHTQYARWVQFHDAADELRQHRTTAQADRVKAKDDAKAKAEAAREQKRADKAEAKRAAEEAKAAEKAAKAEAAKAAETAPAPEAAATPTA